MSRLLWSVALASVAFVVSPVRALEHTAPKLRVGASVGLMGTMPFGSDVGQEGFPDEFERGLWVHVDAVSFDVGRFLQLSAFFRLSVLGNYNGDALREDLRLSALSDGPDAKSAVIGAGARFFPFGDGVVRPYLSLGFGYATAGGRFSTCAGAAGGGLGLPGGGAVRKQEEPECSLLASQEGGFRHKGVAMPLALGVRFDPVVRAFGEPWRLPIALEVSYQKNFWTGVDRDPEEAFRGSGSVSGAHPKVDFLGLLLTFGFLR